MTTAYSLYQLIRGSIPGTRAPGPIDLFSDHLPVAPDTQVLHRQLRAYERFFRGAPHYLTKDYASLGAAGQNLLQKHLLPLLASIFQKQSCLSPAAFNAIKSLPALPEELDNLLLRSRLRNSLTTLIAQHPNASLSFEKAGGAALSLLAQKGLSKKRTLLEYAYLPYTDDADLGQTFKRHTANHRAIIASATKALNEPSNWPTDAEVAEDEKLAAENICDNMLRHLTKDSLSLLKKHPQLMAAKLRSLA